MRIEGDNGETINTHDPDRDQPTIEVSFYNVTLHVSAQTPKEAYDKLTALFEQGCKAGWLEYETDTYDYTTGRYHESDTRPTQELWGK